MAGYPFRLYGDDDTDWYEGPHCFEVQLTRVPSDRERVQLAGVWVEYGPEHGEPWRWSERFFAMTVSTHDYAASMAFAKRVLFEVHSVCTICDVTGWGTRARAGAWTTWSQQRQPQPDPGPRYDPALARDNLFWPRGVDASLPTSAPNAVFDAEVKRLRGDAVLDAVRAAVEASSGLELLEIPELPEPELASLPAEHAHHFEPADTHLDWPIPAALRKHAGDTHTIRYVWDGAFRDIELGRGVGTPCVDVATGRAWFTLGRALHELVLGTGEHRPIWERQPADHGFWGATVFGRGVDRMLVLTTASRLVCFSVTAEGLSATSVKRRKYALPSMVLGDRALGVRGEAGVAFFTPDAGRLTQVASLPKIRAWVSAPDDHRVLLHVARRSFELCGLPELVHKREATRDRKQQPERSSRQVKSTEFRLVSTAEPPVQPSPGVPPGAFELPYATDTAAVYLEKTTPHSRRFRIGVARHGGAAKALGSSDDLRMVGVSPSGSRAHAVDPKRLFTFDVVSGEERSGVVDHAFDTVAIASADEECVLVGSKELRWFATGGTKPELVAIGPLKGKVDGSTPLLLESLGALLLPRGERGLEVYIRRGSSIESVQRVTTPVDSVVLRGSRVMARDSGQGVAYWVENLEDVVQHGRAKLDKAHARGTRKVVALPRARPEALGSMPLRPSAIPGAQGHSVWSPDGTEVARGGAPGRAKNPWLKMLRDGGKPEPVPSFTATWGNLRNVSLGPSGRLLVAGDDGVFATMLDGTGTWLAGIGRCVDVVELADGLLGVLLHKEITIFRRGDDGTFSALVSRKIGIHNTVSAVPGASVLAATKRSSTTVFRFENGGKPALTKLLELRRSGVLVELDGRIYVDGGGKDVDELAGV